MQSRESVPATRFGEQSANVVPNTEVPAQKPRSARWDEILATIESRRQARQEREIQISKWRKLIDGKAPIPLFGGPKRTSQP
jgi:small-conductance mechanosensitive channel